MSGVVKGFYAAECRYIEKTIAFIRIMLLHASPMRNPVAMDMITEKTAEQERFASHAWVKDDNSRCQVIRYDETISADIESRKTDAA